MAITTEEIKAAYSMRDVVERYGFHPTRAGFIPCPFHEGDRHPSLKIYDRDFHCHACGAHGDIFDFIMKIDEIPFNEAFQLLGGRYRPTDQKMMQVRKAQLERRREAKEKTERVFRTWHRIRLNEVCRILRLLDELIVNLVPFSDVWETAVNMREANRYKYEVLAFGERREQEDMRELNE